MYNYSNIDFIENENITNAIKENYMIGEDIFFEYFIDKSNIFIKTTSLDFHLIINCLNIDYYLLSEIVEVPNDAISIIYFTINTDRLKTDLLEVIKKSQCIKKVDNNYE